MSIIIHLYKITFLIYFSSKMLLISLSEQIKHKKYRPIQISFYLRSNIREKKEIKHYCVELC